MKKQLAATTAKGSSTRDRILEIARTKLIQKGIDAFSLRDVALTLGIKLGNVQYYFPSRESLVLQVLADEAAHDRALIQSHLDNSLGASAAFHAIVKDLTTRWRGESGILFSTLGTLAIHNKAFKALYRTIYAEFYVALETPLRRLNTNLSAEELALRARLITALIDGAPMQPQVSNKRIFLERIQTEAESIALA